MPFILKVVQDLLKPTLQYFVLPQFFVLLISHKYLQVFVRDLDWVLLGVLVKQELNSLAVDPN